jgi:hypothetical protein
MYIKIPTTENPRAKYIKDLLSRLASIGSSLTDSELNWAIKFEESFLKYNSLSPKQLAILIEILARHAEDI